LQSLIKVFLILQFWQQAKHASVYLPGKQPWYDLRTGTVYKGGVTHKLDVTEESIPAFQRGGTILTRKDRFRRSSTQMANDPFTLVGFCDDFSINLFLLSFSICFHIARSLNIVLLLMPFVDNMDVKIKFMLVGS
jgi:hypothetical protein